MTVTARALAGLAMALALAAAPAGIAADEGRSVSRAVLSVVGLIFAPLIGGIVLGLLQLGIYRLLVGARLVAADRVPIFPVLLMRGLLVMLALIAIGVFYLKFVERRPTWIEPAPPAAR